MQDGARTYTRDVLKTKRGIARSPSKYASFGSETHSVHCKASMNSRKYQEKIFNTPLHVNTLQKALFRATTKTKVSVLVPQLVRLLILPRDLGLHGCYSASFIVPSTLPGTGFFRLQADEAEFLTTSAFHVLTGPHMLNQHAARHACAEGGTTNHSNNFLPGAIT